MLLRKDNNFIGLLIGQLALIISTPFLYHFDEDLSRFILHMAFIGMILITVLGNTSNKAWIRFVIILVSIEFFILLLSILMDSTNLTVLAMSLSLLFLTASTVIAFNSVFFSQKITLNNLVGASCIYLLLGTIWAILYSNLYFFSDGSFSGLNIQDNRLHFPEFVYYSYVTLTTLGFGDITPLTPEAKTLSFMQAVTGQLYLTIMVAGLVGKAIRTQGISKDA